MADEQKERRGRPAHAADENTRTQVELLAGFGNTEAQIALVLRISEPTLRKYYEHELEVGHLRANNLVAQSIFKMATGSSGAKDKNGKEVIKERLPNVQAAMFWMKCRAGWSEYSPPPDPKPPRQEALGKKEEAERLAITAEEEAPTWRKVLNIH